MALKATRPTVGANTGAGAVAPQQPVATPAPQVAPAPQVTAVAPVQQPTAPAVAGAAGALADLNAGILDNIDNLGNSGNYVSMDGSEFLYKATEERTQAIDLIVNYGKRYYQWVEENGESKIFHDSDTKLDDRYKLKFEVKWDEETKEGDVSTAQFHMPTASAMRFIDYVKELAKAGYGVGNVVTRMTISRQLQKGTTNRYSRAEFTMVGFLDAENNFVEVPNGITTVNKK